MPAYRERPSSEAAEAVAEGAQLVDVREAHEWEQGSLPGAIHIPLGDLADRVGDLDRSRPVALLCRSGGRSGRAAEILVASGFDDVTNLTGGLMALGLAE